MKRRPAPRYCIVFEHALVPCRELFYTHFMRHGEGASDPHPGLSMPGMFQLVMNYRTHSGIIQLLDSIVQCIVHYFPNAIDKLRPEQSNIMGRWPRLGTQT